jgi:flagellar motor switch protein FliG
MSALVKPSHALAPGLARSARLMRALGPDAAPIWAELGPEEAEALSAAMDRLADDPSADGDALRRFTQAQKATSGAGVWPELSALDTPVLASLLRHERPQIVALILSRLTGEAAAKLLRVLPPSLSIEAMQRLLHLGEVHPAAMAGLEQHLKGRIAALSRVGATAGIERIARIFDRLDPRAGMLFLTALEKAEPGSGEKVRSLMFTFDDLAALGAGGLQTLLASADRAALVTALKGARETTAAAFFANVTTRAGDLLREEIAALGPVRRSDVDAARAELVELARQLIGRGEIHAGKAPRDDELIE